MDSHTRWIQEGMAARNRRERRRRRLCRSLIRVEARSDREAGSGNVNTMLWRRPPILSNLTDRRKH